MSATRLSISVEHRSVEVNGTRLHHVAAGERGTPVLLVHGFPETWWAFRGLIEPLARRHRVVAVDLRGFGDSQVAEAGADGGATHAQDLHELIGQLGLGPVHLLGQDLSGGVVVRLALEHPEDVLSLTGVEMALAGFGAEALADVAHGGAWYVGALAAPGVAELLAGRERELIAGHIHPAYGLTAPALTEADTDELVRTYARPGGLLGAAGLYRAMLAEGDELRALVAAGGVTAPVLAVGSAGGPFTATGLQQVSAHPVASVQLDGVGHYVAQEAPERLAEALLVFVDRVDDEA